MSDSCDSMETHDSETLDSQDSDYDSEDVQDEDYKDGFVDGFSLGVEEGYKKRKRVDVVDKKVKRIKVNPVKKRKPVKRIKFDKIISSLSQLIELGESYDDAYEYECTLDIKLLHKILSELKSVNAMIGLAKFKETLVKHIIYLLLGWCDVAPDMRHLIIFGSPGTGKTTLAKLLGRIYAKIGMLDGGKFKIATKTDFVAKYEGQTEHKTKAFLESCLGGVLFIDEAYSIGSTHEDSSSYSRIVVDTLNEFLSKNGDKFICILAGYKRDINLRILQANEGMDRRFTYRYEIDSYSSNELCQIFEQMVSDSGWTLEPQAINKNYFNNLTLFQGNGGDVKTFLEKCKEVHYQRALLLDTHLWKCLTKTDIKGGYQAYCTEKQLTSEDQWKTMFI